MNDFGVGKCQNEYFSRAAQQLNLFEERHKRNPSTTKMNLLSENTAQDDEDQIKSNKTLLCYNSPIFKSKRERIIFECLLSFMEMV